MPKSSHCDLKRSRKLSSSNLLLEMMSDSEQSVVALGDVWVLSADKNDVDLAT